MCYDLSAFTKKIEAYEKKYNVEYGPKPAVPMPLYHVSGFDHPDLPVITAEDRNTIQLANWGLIPFWAKDPAKVKAIQHKTLNARAETLFEKSAYKSVANKGRRCIIIVDGFYDHHWHQGKSFPFFIHRKDHGPIALGGLWNSWRNQDGVRTLNCTVITTRPNDRMAWIHNKPAASETPRMPYIVPHEDIEDWLMADLSAEEVLEMVAPFDQDLLADYTVPKLRGKAYLGNVPAMQQEQKYAELEKGDQTTLF